MAPIRIRSHQLVVVVVAPWGSCSWTRLLLLLSITMLLSRPHHHSTTNAMVIADHHKILREALAAPSSDAATKIISTAAITGEEDRHHHHSDRSCLRWQAAVDLLQTTAQARGRTDRRAGKARLVGLFLVNDNHDEEDGKNKKMLDDFLIAVQPDRSCGRKFIFLDMTANNNNGNNNTMLGSMLIENAPQHQQSGQQQVVSSSRLRGMWIQEAVRGKGYSTLFLAIWLRLCVETGVAVPNTSRINKPLLALSLQKFGFTPIRAAAAADDDVVDGRHRADDGRVLAVNVSDTAGTEGSVLVCASKRSQGDQLRAGFSATELRSQRLVIVDEIIMPATTSLDIRQSSNSSSSRMVSIRKQYEFLHGLDGLKKASDEALLGGGGSLHLSATTQVAGATNTSSRILLSLDSVAREAVARALHGRI